MCVIYNFIKSNLLIREHQFPCTFLWHKSRSSFGIRFIAAPWIGHSFLREELQDTRWRCDIDPAGHGQLSDDKQDRIWGGEGAFSADYWVWASGWKDPGILVSIECEMTWCIYQCNEKEQDPAQNFHLQGVALSIVYRYCRVRLFRSVEWQ